MKKSVLCVIGLLCPPVFAAMPPDAGSSPRSDTAFTLVPGVVVDAPRSTIYLMKPQGGIDSVSVGTGDRIWSTTSATKPLGLYDDALLAQVERPEQLEIALLELDRGIARKESFHIDLPAGVEAAVDEGLRTTFAARTTVRDNALLLHWEHTRRYVGGLSPKPGQAVRETEVAAFRLDPQSTQAVSVDPATFAEIKPAHPASVREWSGLSGIEVVRAGEVFATTEIVDSDEDQRVVLKRWEAVTGTALADVTLFSGAHILQIPSADDRHLLIAERFAPGAFDEYRWSIYSLVTGKWLGDIRHHRSHADFFVAGRVLTYVERPYGRRIGEAWVSEPRKLKAIALSDGNVLWERPLRDPAYRGPYPP